MELQFRPVDIERVVPPMEDVPEASLLAACLPTSQFAFALEPEARKFTLAQGGITTLAATWGVGLAKQPPVEDLNPSASHPLRGCLPASRAILDILIFHSPLSQESWRLLKPNVVRSVQIFQNLLRVVENTGAETCPP
jgi:hypothetical protein